MQPMPDINTLQKVARSPAGQQLLALLQEGNAGDLNRIAAAAGSGKLEEARQSLSALLSSQEARELLKQLEKQL